MTGHSVNLALVLTTARLLSVPVVLWLFFTKVWVSVLASGLLFGAAALTDLLDGVLARSRGQVTTAGIVLDPIADKALVLGCLFAFAEVALIPLWMVIVIAVREVAVTGTRLWLFLRGGRAVSARQWGKHKTIWQMTTLGFLFLLFLVKVAGWTTRWEGRVGWDVGHQAAQVLMAAVVLLSLISGADFFWKLRQAQ